MTPELRRRAADLRHYGIIVYDMEYYHRGSWIRRTTYESGEIVTMKDGEVTRLERIEDDKII